MTEVIVWKMSADKEFLETLNGMLDLMSNLSEGDYLKGADMCMEIKRLVSNMKTNTIYINMSKSKGKGLTHTEKLAKGTHHICKDCGIIISNDEKKILKHQQCITHTRRLQQDRLLKCGIPYDKVNDIIKLKHKGVVNEFQHNDLYEFTLRHIRYLNEN